METFFLRRMIVEKINEGEKWDLTVSEAWSLMATKYYAVKVGRKPGLYTTWNACKEQIHSYSGAIYKSFPTKPEAENYLNANMTITSQQGDNQLDGGCHIFVDGSYHADKRKYSWAFAVYEQGALLYADSGVGEDLEAATMRNVAGELAAAVQAIQWAMQANKTAVVIHHDYTGIAAWALGDWKANNRFTQAYAAFVKPHLDWIRFEKVKGHSGVEGNELVDQLAKQAMLTL